ncbi:unnamed protein product [Ceutorhynchus assimilis]|uniref:Uncharacterized protein n=1 Tax=Ceutorhynchus assimilis TaxID=467358 RepID=A0A9N9MWZ9_9CUCU|nr:unnamed protein product [Ceutorhynchus assimilis]
MANSSKDHGNEMHDTNESALPDHKACTDRILKLNTKVMTYDYRVPLACDATKAMGLNSYFLNLREELLCAGKINLRERKTKMYKLLMEDFLREEKELNEVDLGYIEMHP